MTARNQTKQSRAMMSLLQSDLVMSVKEAEPSHFPKRFSNKYMEENS